MIQVPCKPMSQYLSAAGIQHVDFFSLDVEGSEMAVLSAIDWKRQRVAVLVTEELAHTPEKNAQVRNFLSTTAGMVLVHEACWNPGTCDTTWASPSEVDLASFWPRPGKNSSYPLRTAKKCK